MERRRKQAMVNEKITTKQAYEQFFQDKRAENLSEETLKTYKIHIDSFIESNQFWNMPSCLLNKDLYDFWIEDLQNDDAKKDITVTSYCRSVRAFLYWLQDNDYMEKDTYKLPRYQKTIKECYTDDELSVLLARPVKCSEVEYQTWVFINLICSTGMRLSSCLNIKVSDIKKKDKAIYVQKTKNRKAQVFYISEEMLSILSKYILQFDLGEDDWLFCGATGRQLARRTVQDNVAEFNKKHGVKKTSIHLFRHTFAKNYYNKTKDIYSLCQILGHSSIQTTENYLKDLGLTVSTATAYNPQAIYGSEKKRQKRRGTVTVK